MKNKKNTVLLFGLFVVLFTTLTIWYGRYSKVSVHDHYNKTYLTDTDASKKIESYNSDYNYFYQTISLVESTKTFIPLVYSNKTLSKGETQLLAESKH